MSIDVIMMGQRIRAARKMRNITAEDLAEKIGFATESLGHIECGARKPSLQALYAIAVALDVSMDYLVGRTQSPNAMVEACLHDNELTPEQEKLLLELTKGLLPVIKSKI